MRSRPAPALLGFPLLLTLLAACSVDAPTRLRQLLDGRPGRDEAPDGLVARDLPDGDDPSAPAAPSDTDRPSGGAVERAVVSLTFDDTFADQLAAVPMLQAHGMRATFYVNSTRIGRSADYRYLTESEVRELHSMGHEIGGHTQHHVDLTASDSDEQRRQICDDRAALAALGFDPRTLAYPLGRRDPGVVAAAEECGYAGARITNHTGATYPIALPAAPSFEIPAAPSVTTSTTLDDMKREVALAERTGGWVVFVMHHVCVDCGSRSAIRPEVLEAFLAWLAPRKKDGTVVRTVAQALGAEARPTRRGPGLFGGALGDNRLKNPSFEDATRAPGTVDCWVLGTPGASSKHFTRVADAHDGAFAIHLDGVGRSTTDRRINVTQDAGGCAVPAAPGERLRLRAFAKGTTPLRFSAYVRDGAGFWRSWTSSPSAALGPEYAEVSWLLPAVPDDATAIAVGANLPSEGELTLDDLDLRTAP